MIEEKELRNTTDASVWAKAFVEQFGGDEGNMIGWFANAIETGRNSDKHELWDRFVKLSKDYFINTFDMAHQNKVGLEFNRKLPSTISTRRKETFVSTGETIDDALRAVPE